MKHNLRRIEVSNSRCLQKVALDLDPIPLFSGPNGAGKSTLLDTLWLVRDSAIRGVDVASSNRSHGIGMRWDRARDDEPIVISLDTEHSRYDIRRRQR